MNKRQKETQQAFLDNEKAVLKRLEEVYQDTLGEINGKIELLLARQDADMAHVIYQVQYQKALKDQVSAILEQLHNNEFETLSEYLAQSYEDGFLGTMYDLQGQGIPLVIPIDQEQIVAAIQHDTKISTKKNTKTGKLYASLGEDITDLKKKIAGEISRGISGGMMYSEIARNIAAYGRIPKNNAMRIARTEAHRIQCKAAMDAQWKAKGKGADVVKQWDSSMDARTRDSHARVDGEIRELDEKFSNGLLYPGDPSGRAAEVINCRCALLQKARWKLDIEETKYLGNISSMDEKQRETIARKLNIPVDELERYSGQIVPIRAKNYEDFKRQYNKLWHYEGSDLQKEAQARIAGYKKKNNQNNTTKGLGTGENATVKDHAKPEYIKTIDINNKKAIEKELLDFENESIHEKIETACVITREGKVYKCYGVEDSVYPDYDLGEAIRGAYISHNHPESKTEYSFGKSDFELFCEYELEELRGIDVKYSYKFDRNDKKRDARKDLFDMTDEDWQHDESIKRAEMIDVGYTRVER